MASAEQFVDELLTLPSPEDQQRFLQNEIAPLPANRQEEITTLLKERALALYRQDAGAALHVTTLILSLAGQTAEPSQRALGLRLQAYIRMTSFKEYAAAREQYDEAVALYHLAGDELGEALTNVTRVWALATAGESDRALAVGAQAAVVLEENEQWRALGTLYSNLAAIAGRQNRFEDSLALLEKAAAAHQSAGAAAEERLLDVQGNRAMVLRFLGRFSESIDLCRAMIAQAEAQNHAMMAAILRHTLGDTLFVTGRAHEALLALDAAREAYLAVERRRDAVLIDHGLCQGLLFLGRFESAVERARRVVALCDEIGLAVEGAQARVLEARALAELHLYDQALATLRQAQHAFAEEGNHSDELNAELEAAAILLRQGQTAAASKQIEHSLAAIDLPAMPQNHTLAHLLAAEIYLSLREEDLARRHGRTALAVAGESLADKQEAHHLLGRIAARAGALEEARRHLNAAIEALEQLQGWMLPQFRPDFLRKREWVYADAITLALRQDDPAAALEFSQRAKAQGLLALVTHRVSRAIQPRSAHDTDLVDHLDALRSERNILWRRLESGAFATNQEKEDAQKTLNVLEADIRDRWEQLLTRNAAYQADAALWEVQTANPQPYLNSGTAIVEYYSTRDQLLALVITPEAVRVVQLPASLTDVGLLQQQLQLNLDMGMRSGGFQQLLANARQLLGELHAALLAPVLPLCPDAERLIIVPHQSLHYLPFSALHDGKRYLVEQAAVSTMPNSSFMALQQESQAGNNKASVMGYAGDHNLPYVENEARIVAALFGSHPYLGRAAVREELESLAADGRLLHIAAHGAFRTDAPLFSGIQLADGWLTTLDIFHLHLPVSLVTLSACETGRAAVGSGDELQGLIQAFLTAGAASLLLTLWPVADQASLSFMQTFYGGLLDGQSKSDALRSAQLALLQDSRTAHPFFWGAYMLAGNTGFL